MGNLLFTCSFLEVYFRVVSDISHSSNKTPKTVDSTKKIWCDWLLSPLPAEFCIVFVILAVSPLSQHTFVLDRHIDIGTADVTQRYD